MRWDDLIADLAGQGRSAHDATRGGEVGERARWESGRARLLDRVRASGARRVELGLVGAPELLSGRLAAVGADWLALVAAGGETLVPRSALRSVRFPGPSPLEEPPGSLDSPLQQRLRLPHALRRLARDRSLVQVRTVDGGLLTGTVDRAGHDHLEVAEHPADSARRAAAVRSVILLPYSAVLWVRGGAVWASR